MAVAVPFWMGLALGLGGCTGAGPTDAPSPSLPAAASCTFGAAYWASHPERLGAADLRLGEVSYRPPEQLAILRHRALDNGLVALAQQVIAARLNLAAGAPAEGLPGLLAAADALVDRRIVPPRGEGWRAPGDTAEIDHRLADFNEGRLGPGPCSEPDAPALPPLPAPERVNPVR